MKNTELKGTILWYSEKDENGIIVDSSKNEFQFDRSVVNLRHLKNLKNGSVVSFSKNLAVKDCLCAYNVKLA